MADISQIKKDYLAKIKELWEKYPICSKTPYVGTIKAMYGKPNVDLDVLVKDPYRDYNETRVYGLIENNGKLMCIFSDVDADDLYPLDRLSTADIVKVYNDLQEDYQHNKDRIWFVFKEALSVGNTVRYVGRECKVLAINDDSVELEHIGKVKYPQGFVHTVTIPLENEK